LFLLLFGRFDGRSLVAVGEQPGRGEESLKWAVAGVLLALTAAIPQAWAGATLHIGSGYGTACATGGCPLFNN